MPSSARALRALIAEPEPTVVVECHDVLSARIVQARGVRATYLGGSTLGALLGVPDHGLLTMTEVLDAAARIAGAIDIPLIVDADQGGETSLTVHRTVRDLEQAGVAALHLEDTVNPKHVSNSDQLMSLDDMRARIAAAVGARRSSDLVVIARTDARVQGKSVDETIERGCAFAAEGADVFMVPALGRVQDAAAVVAAVPIPVLDLNRPVANARVAGIAVDLFAGITLRGLLAAQHAVVDQVLGGGPVTYDEPSEVARLTDDATYRTLAERWISGA